MIVTLRTLPRDDGTTSVILTREPGDPRDPEVVNIFTTSRKAVAWMLTVSSLILAKAGGASRGYDTKYAVHQDRPCTGWARFEIDIPAGEEFTLEV